MASRRPHFEVDVVGPELHIVDDEISGDFGAETDAAEQQKSFGRELYDTAVRSGKSSLKLVVRYAPYVVAMLALYALISHKIESAAAAAADEDRNRFSASSSQNRGSGRASSRRDDLD